MPYFSVYGASKAFILNFTQALHEESKESGVLVTCLVPGFTKTNFGAAARMKEGDETPFPVMTAEAVAAAGLKALRKRKAFVVTHPLDRLRSRREGSSRAGCPRRSGLASSGGRGWIPDPQKLIGM